MLKSCDNIFIQILLIVPRDFKNLSEFKQVEKPNSSIENCCDTNMLDLYVVTFLMGHGIIQLDGWQDGFYISKKIRSWLERHWNSFSNVEFIFGLPCPHF
jgi:hypothetical protein